MAKYYDGVIDLGVFEKDELNMVEAFLDNYERDGLKFEKCGFYYVLDEAVDSGHNNWYQQFLKDFLNATGIKLQYDIRFSKRREEKNDKAPLGYYVYEEWEWYVKGVDIRVEPGSVLVDGYEYGEEFHREDDAIKYRDEFDSIYTLADYNINNYYDYDSFDYYERYCDESYEEDNKIGWTKVDIAIAPIHKIITKECGEYIVKYVVVFPKPHKLDNKQVIKKDLKALEDEIFFKEQELNELLDKKSELLKELED